MHIRVDGLANNVKRNDAVERLKQDKPYGFRYYLITIRTYKEKLFLATIKNNKSVLSPVGISAERCWRSVEENTKTLHIDSYIIMPNHIHGIIKIEDISSKGYFYRLGRVLKSFLFESSHHISALTNNSKHIWHHEIIITALYGWRSLASARQYVQNNPRYWHLDSFYPSNDLAGISSMSC